MKYSLTLDDLVTVQSLLMDAREDDDVSLLDTLRRVLHPERAPNCPPVDPRVAVLRDRIKIIRPNAEYRASVFALLFGEQVVASYFSDASPTAQEIADGLAVQLRARLPDQEWELLRVYCHQDQGFELATR